MSAILRLVVCSLSLLAAPAQLHVIESIFEHGIIAKGNVTSRAYNIPAGTCDFTLYPSNLMCTVDNPNPYWLQIKVVDLKVAFTSVSEDLLEVSVRRTEPARHGGRGGSGARGHCYSAAKAYLTAKCGPKHIATFHKWGSDFIDKY